METDRLIYGDLVDKVSPRHYKNHPSGVEPIRVTEHLTFCLGNVIKYLCRRNLKGNPLVDIGKARWYLQREMQRCNTWAVTPPTLPVEVAADFDKIISSETPRISKVLSFISRACSTGDPSYFSYALEVLDTVLTDPGADITGDSHAQD
mgnify:CR=1 FL=1